MKTFGRILLYEGVILLLSALLPLMFGSAAYFYPIVLGGAGLVCLVVGLIIRFSEIMEGFSRRSTKQGINVVIYTIIFLGIVGLVNVLAANHPMKYDLTKAKINTLSEQTLNMIKNLPSEAKIVGFFKAGEAAEFQRMADRYADASKGKLKVEVIDPDLHPELVKGYAITQRGAVAVTCGGRSNVTMSITEQGLTTALLKVSNPTSGAVYFLQGHGEVPIDGQEERGYALIKKGLENENINLQPLMLITAGKIPADARLVVIAGPTKPLAEEEVNLLRAFLDQGGRLMVMADPATDTGLDKLLHEYGVELDNDIVVDRQVQLFQGAVLGFDPIVVDYGAHEIVKKIGENPTLFHMARSLKILNENRPGAVMVEPILRTSSESWGETDLSVLSKGGDPKFEEGKDTKGPLVLGAAIEKALGAGEQKKTARLVVIGDADFIANRYAAQGFNADLFLNAVNWLTGQEAYITIRPNTFAPDVFTLTEEERSIIFFVSVFLLPQIIVMLGIGVALRNKR